MSEDKSQVDERNEERDDEDEPEVEAHRMKARLLGPEDTAEPGARAKRPTGH